ncbi:hypothetical protein [Paracraurococcus lichenis]|uniref:Uncharacterized protein n=1 Tax=Paracraurococcus lichenis TaxID=3064888 RepID=A0ABT9E375_9PROT|nr:hypothetical protein [Paracraurococcus sp. LOR1-02]MDO9710540.1 hypothetical protein [Paracraurococcus sp. LOR1-02]
MIKQGYLTLATGPKKYTDMAINLAASLQVMDPKRPICLFCDETYKPDEFARFLFRDIIVLPQDSQYPHVMNKIRVFDNSPYDASMFVDADCLLVKNDVDHWWRASSQRAFSITGLPQTAGEWKGVKIEDVIRQENINYLVKMNAGVYYFDKSDSGKDFFKGLKDYYVKSKERLSISNYKGPNSQSFELYLGLFMGKNNMDCTNVANLGENSWMVSTWRALWCDFRPHQGVSTIYKGDDHLFQLPFLPRKVTKLSPTFAHFIGLKPKRIYQKLAAEFRATALMQREKGATASELSSGLPS